MAVTGRVDEFGARLPGAVLVLVMGLGISIAARRTYGPAAGLLAGFLVLANFEMIHKGRLLEIEGTYIALTGLAWAAWLGWVAGPDPKPWRGWTVAGICLGLAFLAKGPVHLIMFYAVVIASHWTDRTLRHLRHPAHFWGLLVAAAVAIPWFLIVAARSVVDPATADAVEASSSIQGWIGELTSRLDPRALDFGSWVVQIFKGIFNFFPGAILLLLLAWRPLRERWFTRDNTAVTGPSVQGLVRGLIIGYLIIALTPAARARFSMPMLVPSAVLVAVLMTHLNVMGHAMLVKGWGRAIAGSLPLLALAAIAGPFLAPEEYRAFAVSMSTIALGLGVLVFVFRGSWLSTSWPRLMMASAVVMAGVTAFYVGSIQPMQREREVLRPVAAALRAHLNPGETAIVYKAALQPWMFYLWYEAREVSSWGGLSDPLPGPLVIQPKYWEREGEKFIRQYGPHTAIERIPNPWDRDDLLIVRWSKGS